MSLLIVAATELEIKPIINLMNGEADFLIHGIGAGSTSYHITKKICANSYDLVIQTGIAGTYEGGPMLGEAVGVISDRYADLGIEEKGMITPLEKAGFAAFDQHPFTNGCLMNPWVSKWNAQDLRMVTAATVNLIHDDMNRTQKLVDQFHPEIETMEGAAFHQVCIMENIPFIQIRGISNHVGVRDKSRWKMDQAIESTVDAVRQIITRFKSDTLWK
jgi:futalosine hydrolase